MVMDTLLPKNKFVLFSCMYMNVYMYVYMRTRVVHACIEESVCIHNLPVVGRYSDSLQSCPGTQLGNTTSNTNVHMQTNVHMINMYMNVYMYAYVHMHVHMHVHIDVHMHVHIDLHIHIHV